MRHVWGLLPQLSGGDALSEPRREPFAMTVTIIRYGPTAHPTSPLRGRELRSPYNGVANAPHLSRSVQSFTALGAPRSSFAQGRVPRSSFAQSKFSSFLVERRIERFVLVSYERKRAALNATVRWPDRSEGLNGGRQADRGPPRRPLPGGQIL